VSAIRESRGDRVFLTVVYIFLALVTAITLYPLIYVFSASLSSANAVINGEVWLWPVHLTMLGYEAVLRYGSVLQGFVNSVEYTSGSVILTVVLTVLLAYPLSRKSLPGRKVVIWALLIALMFNGGLIPYYLVVKNLGLLNTALSQIIPSAMNVWLVILAKTYFQSTVSQDLYEAAQLDGCGEVRFLARIVVPLSMPIIAVIVLITAVTHWNSYFDALIFLNSQRLYPLQLVLRQILIEGQTTLSGFGVTTSVSSQAMNYLQDMATLMKYSLIVITTVPIVLLYPLVQRYFVKGIMIGSIKE
jgi:putative aldouronate transport system permease protein